jgi:phosphate-selective porin OprO/OprP
VYPHSIHQRRLLALAIAGLFPLAAQAEGAATEDRIKQLEQIVQQMQQQRAEQDKQLQMLTEELAAMQQQMANSKEDRVKEKGKSEGRPVYAAFKDGLTFEDGSGNWKLQINGRVQADYRTFDPTEWKDDVFSIRRARFGGTFNFLKDFVVRVEGEYANDNTGAKATTALTYAYLDFNRWKSAKIRAGQFKPFFGLERAYSTNFADFAELSLATNNGSLFTSTYDRGVMVHGDPLPWLNYNLYVVNGTGQNNDDQNDSKDIGGRINANFASLAEIRNAVIHVGASASKGDLGKTSVSQVTEGNGSTFFSVTGLASNADRDRWGVETALAYGPVKFQTEYIEGNFEGIKGATAYDHDIKAWYADINWLVTGETWSDAYKSGVFGRVKPKRNFDDKDGWGAFELGLRYSNFDASDFKAMLPAATATTSYVSEAEGWTVGAKWILNPNARIVLNYIRTEFDEPARLTVNRNAEDSEQALVLRAQYDF